MQMSEIGKEGEQFSHLCIPSNRGIWEVQDPSVVVSITEFEGEISQAGEIVVLRKTKQVTKG